MKALLIPSSTPRRAFAAAGCRWLLTITASAAQAPVSHKGSRSCHCLTVEAATFLCSSRAWLAMGDAGEALGRELGRVDFLPVQWGVSGGFGFATDRPKGLQARRALASPLRHRVWGRYSGSISTAATPATGANTNSLRRSQIFSCLGLS